MSKEEEDMISKVKSQYDYAFSCGKMVGIEACIKSLEDEILVFEVYNEEYAQFLKARIPNLKILRKVAEKEVKEGKKILEKMDK